MGMEGGRKDERKVGAESDMKGEGEMLDAE